MRVRIVNDGPEWWKLRVEDIETGKRLPITDITFKAGEGLNANLMTAEVTLVVDEIDVTTDAIRMLKSAGYHIPEPMGMR